MKPKVFLSHNKNDLALIQRIANDLQSAFVDVWFDEWEIPPGDSLRDKIFEDGIPECDLFFVYLSVHSITSYWVKEELDAAFVLEAEQKGGFMAFFVESEEIRSELRPDIRSKLCPILTDTEYAKPLRQLISKSWQAAHKNRLRVTENEKKLEILKLQKEKQIVENNLEELRAQSTDHTNVLIEHLSKMTLSIAGRDVSADSLFELSAPRLGLGTAEHILAEGIGFVPTDDQKPFFEESHGTRSEWLGFIGKMVALGLVRPRIADEIIDSDYYYLTELGALVSQKVMMASLK